LRTAIVHDYLSQRGGAERVVLAMADVFPGAPVFTSFYAPGQTYPEFEALDVRTSRLQGSVDPDHFRRAVLRLPGAFSGLDLSAFDQVIVSSSAFAHRVRHHHSVVYCYTPPHFLYDTRAYLGSRTRAWIANPLLSPMRRRDRAAAAAHRAYAAISRHTAVRIRTVYGRSAPVIHPPLATGHLPVETEPLPSEPRALIVARLLPYKRIDVAIEACARAGVLLTVVGEGPEETRLRRLAPRGVTFLGQVDDGELAGLFRDHSVVLAPGLEDFGYGPVEANFAGRPVVALAAGGALETIDDGANGILVHGWDPAAWAEAVSRALSRTWDPDGLRTSTRRFHADVFRQRLCDWVASTWADGGADGGRP
jgi:glycosyltransferase involved in cell wall biosynthesis